MSYCQGCADRQAQLNERDAEIERLKASVRDRAASECIQYDRAEAAEARVYLTPEAMESMTAVMKIGAEYAEEAKTLRTRVAELEEKLMVMCVAQINGAEPTPLCWVRMLNGAIDWGEDCMAVRPQDLQIDSMNEYAEAGEVFTAEPVYTLKQLVPTPDPPAPAPLAAQGVEGEPHHER